MKRSETRGPFEQWIDPKRVEQCSGRTPCPPTHRFFITLSSQTKDREPCFDTTDRPNLFRDIWGIITKHHCHLYRINGVEDHIHILSSLHPTVALADFVKDIKLGSSSWIKESGAFPRFRHWQDGYGAFTASWSERNDLIEYIKNQEEHHKQVSFKDELREFLVQHGVTFDEKYLV